MHRQLAGGRKCSGGPVVQVGFFRPNLTLTIVAKQRGRTLDGGLPLPHEGVADFICRQGPSACGIVYALTREDAESLAAYLVGFPLPFSHFSHPHLAHAAHLALVTLNVSTQKLVVKLVCHALPMRYHATADAEISRTAQLQ